MNHRLLSGIVICVMILAVRTASAQAPVDQSPLNIGPVDAFPNIRIPRPVVVTHAGDGSQRLFVVAQEGQIHVFPNRSDVKKTEVFLDIGDKVVYQDNQNEEGLLGLAFHPKYRENGQLFVYYTTVDAPHTSVISRFRVSADDPNRADPGSEQEIMRIEQPFWNHNGGTIVFGPDGYLYVGLGDGGSANDPMKHGQNLATWLGSILRIDIDRQDEGKAYAIPPDNPFLDRRGAAPEIYAYGLRNVWRISFDRETGLGWAADVGQDLWEEINIVRSGGNYGWNLREGMHKFGRNGAPPRDDLIEPIWEYHHSVGKSITGGHVYRGTQLPQLQGLYLYGDYVSGDIWALRYDAQQGKVVANHPLQSNKLPVVTFGEDERGEVYFTTVLGGGIIYRFQPIAP